MKKILANPKKRQKILTMDIINGRDFSREFLFTTSRSSGAGGQNVNKVNTKVELRFNLWNSTLLSEREKAVILTKERGRVNQEGFLVLVCQTERSQLRNKEKVIEKFYSLLRKDLAPVRKRISTKPTKASKHKRLEKKKQHAQKKSMRQKPID